MIILICTMLVGQGRSPAESAMFWEYHAVVYAQVVKTIRLSPPNLAGPGDFNLVLRPKATISGKFDPCTEPEIEVLLMSDGPPFVEFVPRENTMIVAMIFERYNRPPPPLPLVHETKFQIELQPMPFFPQRETIPPPGFPNAKGQMVPVVGYIEVERFDDPKVEAIRNAIVKLRAEGKPVP